MFTNGNDSAPFYFIYKNIRPFSKFIFIKQKQDKVENNLHLLLLPTSRSVTMLLPPAFFSSSLYLCSILT